AGSTLLMYGGSFNTQGDLTVSGTIRGAGTIGGPIGGTGILSAEHGTLDLTGTVASGLTFQIASYGTLKIDGTATTANLVGMTDVNQVLEIGLSGDLTITGSSGYNTAGTVKLDGGTLTDAPTYGTGGQGVFTGFGTMNGTVRGGPGRAAPAIHATGGTLTINGDMYSGDRPDIAAGATFNLLVRRFQNNAPMSSGCIVDFVTPGVDDGLVIDVGNERHPALLELVFGADADVAQDRTRQL